MTTQTVSVSEAARRHTTKGRTFDPDPLTVDDFARQLAACIPLRRGPTAKLYAARLRAMIVVNFRTGVRVSELIAFSESDLNREQQTLLVRRGKGGKRRLVMMDKWAWTELEHWVDLRQQIRPGALFPILVGRNMGGPLSATDVRRQYRAAGERAALRKRVVPHQHRHGFAVGYMAETNDLIGLQRQLGHSSPTVTGVYLRGIDDVTALSRIAQRQPPMILIPPMD